MDNLLMEGKNLKMVGWLFGDHQGKAVQIRLKPAGTGNKRNRNRQEQHHNLVSRIKENE